MEAPVGEEILEDDVGMGGEGGGGGEDYVEDLAHLLAVVFSGAGTHSVNLNVDDVREELKFGPHALVLQKFFDPNSSLRCIFCTYDPSRNAMGEGRLSIDCRYTPPCNNVAATLFLSGHGGANGVGDLSVGLCEDGIGGGTGSWLGERIGSVCLPLAKIAHSSQSTEAGAQESSTVRATVDVDSIAQEMAKVKKLLNERIKIDTMPIKVPDESFLPPHMSLASAAGSDEVIKQYSICAETWCEKMEKVLRDDWNASDGCAGDCSPDHHQKLKWQTSTMGALLESLRAKDALHVSTALKMAKSEIYDRYAGIERELTSALHKKRSDLKYVEAVRPVIAPIYEGTPNDAVVALNALKQTLKVLRNVFHGKDLAARMRPLFKSIAEEAKECCKRHLCGDESASLWKQDLSLLVEKLQHCLDLNQVLKQQCATVVGSLNLEGQELEPHEVCYAMYKFSKRAEKLFDMFSTVNQFTRISAHKVDGVHTHMQSFFRILAEFKNKPHKLLDECSKKFDDDYITFNIYIQELEGKVRGVVDDCMAKIKSIDELLKILDYYHRTLERTTLRTYIQLKMRSAYQRYGEELRHIRSVYEANKDKPPTPRHNAPVAGAVDWARNLLCRVARPMQTFKLNAELMRSKESKNIVQLHNSLANALVQFEVMWVQAWEQSLVAHSGVAARLSGCILSKVPHLPSVPSSGDGAKTSKRVGKGSHRQISESNSESVIELGRKICPFTVTIDSRLFTIVSEAKALRDMGIRLPPIAKELLQREVSIKTSYQKVRHLLSERSRVIDKIPSRLFELFKPRVADLDKTLSKGSTQLTWSSMGLDMYLSQGHECLEEIERVATVASNIIDVRINHSLKQIGALGFVDMLEDAGDCGGRGSIVGTHVDAFVAAQEAKAREATDQLDRHASNVVRAVGEIISFVAGDEISQGLMGKARRERCVSLFAAYQSLTLNQLQTTLMRSIHAITDLLLCESGLPAFEVHLELHGEETCYTPIMDRVGQAIDDILSTILKAAARVGSSLSRETSNAIASVLHQGRADKGAESSVARAAPTMVNAVAESAISFVPTSLADDPSVKALLKDVSYRIMTLKQDAEVHRSGFASHRHLWCDDKRSKYAEFMATEPDMDDFGAKLGEFAAAEEMIAAWSSEKRLLGIVVRSDALKNILSTELQEWKRIFSESLHTEASQRLKKMNQYLQDTSNALETSGHDLDSARKLMDVLASLRERDMTIDTEMGPIEDMYLLLQDHGVKLDLDEKEMVRTLHTTWTKILHQADEVKDQLAEDSPAYHAQLVQDVAEFRKSVTALRADFIANGPMVDSISPIEAMGRLEVYSKQFEQKDQLYRSYSAGEDLFGMPQTAYPEHEQTRRDLTMYTKLYSLYTNVLASFADYKKIAWVHVAACIEDMTTKVNLFESNFKALPLAMKEIKPGIELKQTIGDFKQSQPLLEYLSNKAMRPRHWKQIMEVTGHELPVDSEIFNLENLLAANLVAHFDEIEEICQASIKEQGIEAKLRAVADDWASADLAFKQHNNKGALILKGDETNELMERLEDTQMTLGTIMSSRYVKPFFDEVSTWQERIGSVADILEAWVQVQAVWMYLEPVFTSGDISKQLPREAKRFQTIDKTWDKIMQKAYEVRSAVTFCGENDMLRQTLPEMDEQLRTCQKSLDTYLETKRSAFPRFYFISDTALLEILSKGSDPQAILPHLENLFDSLSGVTFDPEDPTKIVSIYSSQGEICPLAQPVKAEGNIEVWLGRLELAMQQTIHGIIRQAAIDCETMPLESFIDKNIAQVALLGLQFKWTHDVEDALALQKRQSSSRGGGMAAARQKINGVLKELVRLTTKDLSKMDRTKIETLITIQVHQRDVFEELYKQRAKIKDRHDFEWQKQARFYWNPNEDQAVVSIADVNFRYCNEYLGCTDRLVITPLTDRCYISLAQALGMCLGGAPAGPAGTGKTETVKDLGKAIGKYVVVFNCSDQYSIGTTAMIYKGLAMSGAWGCFDEFNRINIDVLSVVAAQVETVLTAIKSDKSHFVFTDGSTVSLRKETGFFITMNPGYAGRQELPENLKRLFRGVAMIKPDREIIMKVKLAAAGYESNAELAVKFNTLYDLCEQQLSKQRHYDFGLRNILSVLRTAGATKREQLTKPESELLRGTLQDMNMSKFVAEDVPIFKALLNDIFPNVKAEKKPYPEVEASVRRVIQQDGLQSKPQWVDKIMQLYETSLVRHGIMVIGPAGVGKTTCIHTLLKALSNIGIAHKEVRMNPKAISDKEMFGTLDKISNEWTDGVFSTIWRKANTNKDKGKHTWIALDGPVDAIWIENLNTVLDDNKLLTLANGDRLPMKDECRLVFEAEDLRNASPATVSRAGIIYMSEEGLGWEVLIESWLAGGKVSALEPLLRRILFAWLPVAFECVREKTKPVMDTAATTQVTSLLTVIDGLVGRSKNANCEVVSETHVSRIVCFALAWSIGALLEAEDRLIFNACLLKIAPESCHVPGCDVMSPAAAMNGSRSNGESSTGTGAGAGSTFYDFWLTDDGQWRSWVENPCFGDWRLGNGQAMKDVFHTVIIPTAETARLRYLIDLFSQQGRPVLLTGSAGTSKTASVSQYLKGLDEDIMAAKTLSLSAATTPQIMRHSISSCVEKRQGRTYGPAGGKKLTIFIDDVSMPEYNEWDDMPTNEFTRQVVEERLFFDTAGPKNDTVHLQDLNFVVAMPHPGGGRNDIPNRLKRHFAAVNIPVPEASVIKTIFGRMVNEVFGVGGDFRSPNPPRGGRGQSMAIQAVCSSLTEATLEIWQLIRAKMLPTPSKFHYIFTLREISRVFQGIFQASKDVLSDPLLVIALWRNECERVMKDRLIDKADQDWFAATLDDVTRKHFSDLAEEVIATTAYFVDFLRDPEIDAETGEPMGPAPKIYETCHDLGSLRTRLEGFMEAYNEASKVDELDLVLFDQAILHLIRISRILSMPGGNALLVGVGGSGKQSLTKLAAFIAGQRFIQIQLTKSYNVTNLLDDFRAAFKLAGVKGEGVVFCFSDAQIKDEAFLEYINMFLLTGEIQSLLPRDEMDVIVGEISTIARQERPDLVDTKEAMIKFFFDRVRANLHIVLCFSPVGDKFRTRARRFPGLISGCTIDWFMAWPSDALLSVSTKLLNNFKLKNEDSVRDRLASFMAEVHSDVQNASERYFHKFRRRVYVTPKSYLSFVSSFKSFYQAKLLEVGTEADKINAGLKALQDGEQGVKDMKVSLSEQDRRLAKSSKQTQLLVDELEVSTAKAEKKKSEVQAERNVIADHAKIVEAHKSETERDLLAAKPALDAAEQALLDIKKNEKDLQVVKKLPKPPDLVKRILDSVLILRNEPLNVVEVDEEGGLKRGVEKQIKASWDCALTVLSDSQFVQSLLEFDRDKVNEETVDLLAPYFAMSDFNVEKAKNNSKSVAGLCSWVRAMNDYYRIAKDVKPKMEKLRVAESEVQAANTKLEKAQSELDEQQAELDGLQANYDDEQKKLIAMQDKADQTRRKMKAATNLIEGLQSEKTRWTKQSQDFAEEIRRLVGDAALAAAFVSYCGPFNQEFRQQLQTTCFLERCRSTGVPVSSGFAVTKFLVDEATVGKWNLEGLPKDELSIQNGIVVTNSRKWPLLIDPQGQGLKWVARREACRDVRVTTLDNRNFRNDLDFCVENGVPLLVENVPEEIDPSLDPIIEKQLQKRGKGWKVVLADKELDWHEDFCLYLTTKLPNPRFSPEMSSKVTLIDFTVTTKGLEEQLLARVVLKEKSHLEEQRRALLEEITNARSQLKDLQGSLLTLLSSSSDLLEDAELLENLNRSKKADKNVQEKLNTNTMAEKRINDAREVYRPVAVRGSLLYFSIVELSLVDNMYEISLAQFLSRFDLSLVESAEASTDAKRIENIIDHMTYAVYRYVSRGIFQVHNVTFLLMIAFKIATAVGAISPDDVMLFLKGGGALSIAEVPKKPYAWISDGTWLNLVQLSRTCAAFEDLLASIEANTSAWRKWYDREAPEAERVPDFEEVLPSMFFRMLLVRCFREDRTLVVANEFIKVCLGPRYVEYETLRMDDIVAESGPTTPVVCILSQGSDPTDLINGAATRHKKKVLSVSMGQGQAPKARQLIDAGATSGDWVLVQNYHLGLNEMMDLDQTVAGLDDPHPDFRLWITSEPDRRFPIGLLQMSLKLTNEAPAGMKAGLKKSFTAIDQEAIESVHKPGLLFSLSFLHSVVQERRKFGPLGWNVRYEFNDSDQLASAEYLRKSLISAEMSRSPIDWSALRYMICEVHYGGRITDDYDRRLFNTYGRLWLTQRALEPGFQFHAALPVYKIPTMDDVEQVRDYIETLPNSDTPEVYGMHPNAAITYRSNKTKDCLDTILDIQPKENAGAGGETREDTVRRLIAELNEQLPPLFEPAAVETCLDKQTGGRNKPLTIVLKQEVDRLQIVLRTVKETLCNLDLAISGTIVLSSSLLVVMNSLFDARVPERWQRISWQSPTLGIWFSSLVARHQQLNDWLLKGRPNSFWLTGFFNAQGFLTAMRQEVTRRHQKEGWALDDVVLKTEVTKMERHEVGEAPEEGVYVHGLFLEAASWDKRSSRVAESPAKVLFSPLPVIHFSAHKPSDKATGDRAYTCPLYRNRDRTGLNYVCDVDLRCHEADSPDKWTLRGVALLCSID